MTKSAIVFRFLCVYASCICLSHTVKPLDTAWSGRYDTAMELLGVQRILAPASALFGTPCSNLQMVVRLHSGSLNMEYKVALFGFSYPSGQFQFRIISINRAFRLPEYSQCGHFQSILYILKAAIAIDLNMF